MHEIAVFVFLLKSVKFVPFVYYFCKEKDNNC